jgi:hypothetical protein
MLLALSIQAATQSMQAPVIDCHQHLFSPAAAALVSNNPNATGINARNLVELLDSAGIQRALVLSMAYTWGKAPRAGRKRIRARAVRLGCGGNSIRVSEGGLGLVPTTSADACGATRYRHEHPTVHALISRRSGFSSNRMLNSPHYEN